MSSLPDHIIPSVFGLLAGAVGRGPLCSGDRTGIEEESGGRELKKLATNKKSEIDPVAASVS